MGPPPVGLEDKPAVAASGSVKSWTVDVAGVAKILGGISRQRGPS
jgi:hypothetical protein